MIKAFTLLLFFLSSGLGSIAQFYNETDKIIPETPIENGQFGTNLKIYEEHLIVGVPKENRVYIYQKNSFLWQQIAILSPSDDEPGKNFGYDVDIYDNTIIVGAPGSNMSPSADPSVYIFEKHESGWVNMNETARLSRTLNEWEQIFDNPSFDYFGESVAIYKNTAVVGAYKYNSDDYNLCGGVFVYVKPETGWSDMTETAHLYASDEDDNNNLGRAVDIFEDIIVAGEGRMNMNSSAYLFQKPTTGWSDMNETAKFTPKIPEATFGCDISIDGNTVVIGAELALGYEISSGAVYVFEKPNDGWVTMNETAFLIPSSGYGGDDFGSTVSISENFIVVGANGAYNTFNYVDGGLAYFFEKPSEGWSDMTESAILYASDGVNYDKFGYSVINTANEIFIGAIETDNNSISKCGSIYHFNYVYEPQDISLEGNSINECSKIGNFIGKFSALDGNKYDKHEFKLVNEGENEFDNSDFIIKDDSLLNNTNLDYEKKELYSIFVQVTDSTNLSCSKSFEINVDNVEPILENTSFVVEENSPNGTYVGQVICKGDTNSVYYNIEYNNYGAAFIIGAISGKIFVGIQSSLDKDKYDYFDLVVSVRDGNNGDEATVLIEYGTPTTTNSYSENNLYLYPNPSENYVYLDLDITSNRDWFIEIYNSNGNLKYAKTINSEVDKVIDIKFLSNGIYFMKLSGGNKSFIKKFVKQ